jgi:hypothetical protein
MVMYVFLLRCHQPASFSGGAGITCRNLTTSPDNPVTTLILGQKHLTTHCNTAQKNKKTDFDFVSLLIMKHNNKSHINH